MKATGNISNPRRDIWLFSKGHDLLLLGLPIWLCWLVCFALPTQVMQQEIALWVWVVVVLGIDVGHVWSTIFRTYLDRDEWINHQAILRMAPIAAASISFAVAWLSQELFWTLLAYLALYHFMKQQFGFMQLYKAKYGRTGFKKRISDKTAIYISMLYPVLFWHLSSDRQFEWFVSGDFLILERTFLNALSFPWSHTGSFIYFGWLICWLIEEVWLHHKHKETFPLGKWLLVLTTAGNWYLGIVYFNSDLAFTLTNVIAHGIPYYVLILIYIQKKNNLSTGNRLGRLGIKYIPIIILSVLFLAFGEEYLWDMLLYGDNSAFFETILKYPLELVETPFSQALALAFLSLPQIVHYILDGFIWKSNSNNPYLKPSLMQ